MPQSATANIYASSISVDTYRRVLAATEAAEEKANIILAKALADLRRQLSERINAAAARGYDTGPFTTARLKQLIQETQKIIGAGGDAAAAKFQEFIKNSLYDLAIREVDVARLTLAYAIKAGTAHPAIMAGDGIVSAFDPAAVNAVFDSGTVDGVSKSAGLRWAIASPEPHIISSLVQATPIRGHIMTKWVNKWSDALKYNVAAELTLGFSEGQTAQQIVKRLQRATDLSQVAARTLIRTSFAAVSANARGILFAENADIVKGVQWVAKLDSHTTPICRELDEQIFPLDKGPRPPAHYNCRSTIAPVLKTFEEIFGEKAPQEAAQETPTVEPIPASRALTLFRAHSLAEAPAETVMLDRSNNVSFLDSVADAQFLEPRDNMEWAVWKNAGVTAEKVGQLDTVLAESYSSQEIIAWVAVDIKKFLSAHADDLKTTVSENVIKELVGQEFTEFNYFSGKTTKASALKEGEAFVRVTVPPGARVLLDEGGDVLLDRGLRFRITDMKVGAQALTVIDVKPVAYDYRRDALRPKLTEIGADTTQWSRLPINQGLVFKQAPVTSTPVSSVFAGAVSGAIDVPVPEIYAQAGLGVKYYEVPAETLADVVTTDEELEDDDRITNNGRASLHSYSLNDHQSINRMLRTKGEGSAKLAEKITQLEGKEAAQSESELEDRKANLRHSLHIDKIIADNIAGVDEYMAVGKTQVNLTVYRSLTLSAIFPEITSGIDLRHEDEAKEVFEKLLGKEFTEYGFSSTTLSRGIAQIFTSRSGVKATLRISVPSGISAIGIEKHGEGEILLDRGLRYKIVGMSLVDYNDPKTFADNKFEIESDTVLKRMTLDVEVIGYADDRNAACEVLSKIKSLNIRPWRSVPPATSFVPTTTPIANLPEGAIETTQPDILPELPLDKPKPPQPDVYTPINVSEMQKVLPSRGTFDTTEEEDAAILEYTDGGIHYHIPALLAGNDDGRAGETLTQAASIVTEIDSVMNKSRLQRNSVLYRGVSLVELFPENPPSDIDKTVGQTINAQSYMSTSIDIGIAAEFALAKANPILLKINSPAGTSAILASDWTKSHKDELEVLLDRGLSLKITKVENVKVIGTARPTMLTVMTVDVVGYDQKAVRTGNNMLVYYGAKAEKLKSITKRIQQRPAKAEEPAGVLKKPDKFTLYEDSQYDSVTTLPGSIMTAALTQKEEQTVSDYINDSDDGKFNKILAEFTTRGKSRTLSEMNHKEMLAFTHRVEAMDSVFRKSLLAKDTELYRGALIDDIIGKSMSPDEVISTDFVGQEFTFGAYTSTSTSKDVATRFISSPLSVLLKVRAPAKIGAIAASQEFLTSVPEIADELEIILDRGLRVKVIKSEVEEIFEKKKSLGKHLVLTVDVIGFDPRRNDAAAALAGNGIEAFWGDPSTEAVTALGTKKTAASTAPLLSLAGGISIMSAQHKGSELLLPDENTVLKALGRLTQVQFEAALTDTNSFLEMSAKPSEINAKKLAAPTTKDLVTLVGALDNSMTKLSQKAAVFAKVNLVDAAIGEEATVLGYTEAFNTPRLDAVKLMMPKNAAILSVLGLLPGKGWATSQFLLDRGLRFRVIGIENGVRIVEVVGYDDRRDALIPSLYTAGFDVGRWLSPNKKLAAVYAAASVVDVKSAKTGLPGSKAPKA